jgi:hypothetical protein
LKQANDNHVHRERDPTGHCHTHGVPRLLVPPFPIEIVEDEQQRRHTAQYPWRIPWIRHLLSKERGWRRRRALRHRDGNGVCINRAPRCARKMDPGLPAEVIVIKTAGKEAMLGFHLAEIDHIFGIGIPLTFAWRVSTPGHEKYMITSSHREGKAMELLDIEKVADKWLYAMRIVSQAGPSDVLAECKDHGFPNSQIVVGDMATPCVPGMLGN